MKFYKENAVSYAKSTFNQDFAKTVFNGMEDFIKLNVLDTPILDIGCGSGRDAQYLTSKGFKVHAFDQSKEMIDEAKKLTNLQSTFNVGSAQDFQSKQSYYFSYSIACLLHLNDDEFEKAITNIFKHLNFGGHFYFTVKKGTGEEIDSAGRYFNYYTEEKINNVFSKLGLHVLDIKENPDLTRPDTTWLNVLIQKPL